MTLDEYFYNDKLAASTWLNKYAAKDKHGKPVESTPIEMHQRMANEFERIELKYQKNITASQHKTLSDYGRKRGRLDKGKIFEMFHNFKYVVPGGSVMASLGTDSVTSLSNCFVIDSPKDNYTSIMAARTSQIHLMKRRGGVGYDLSNLRPSGSPVNNAAGSATGPASFMEVASSITKEVAQDGRRGALMLTLDIRHPDSLKFIEMKQDLTKVTGANVSVKVPDDFMEAVLDDQDYLLRYPVDVKVTTFDMTAFNLDELYSDGKGGYLKRVNARDLWEKLIYCAWNTAEPGILFIDTIHRYSPDGVYDDAKAISTNPCGEIPLGPYDSCRLIHLVLPSFVEFPYTEVPRVNWKLLYETSYDLTMLADDLVDLEIEAVDKIIEKAKMDGDFMEFKLWKKIKETALKYRRVGIGFTGLADAVAGMNLQFGGEDSLALIHRIMSVIFKAQLDATIDMAITRGTFEGYDGELEGEEKNSWFKMVENLFPEQYDRMQKFGRRNLSFSTVAPTGTVSIVAGVSSGIEPVFQPYYMRRRKVSNANDRVDFVDRVGEKFTEFAVIHPAFKNWIEDKNPMLDIDSLSMESLEKMFKVSPWFKSTAPEINWFDRVRIQSVVQGFITHAISSTINMPENTTVEEVSKIYTESWLQGLKGITVYRDNCRQGILNSITTKDASRQAPKRPKVLEADYYQVKSKGKQYIVLVGLLNDKPYEIFTFEPLKPVEIDQHKGKITKVKKGHYSFDSAFINISDLQLSNSNIEEKAATLYTSMLLRHGADINFVVKTAKKVNDNITSFSSAMCRVLAKYAPKGHNGEACPECGGVLIRESGCDKCLDCGYSKCL